jgi:DNA-binding NarL/FixJ family response regulator
MTDDAIFPAEEGGMTDSPAQAERQLRIVIAEDSVVLRDGLVRLLTAKGHLVVAEAGDPDSLLVAVAEHRPDIAVVDVRMPPTHTDDGLRASIVLRDRYPELAIMVFSQYVEVRAAATLLSQRATGIGYLLKDRVADVGVFLDALEQIAAGGTVLDPEVVTRLIRAGSRGQTLSGLTRRELDVLSLMAQGRSNGAIAAALVISAGAVEKYVTSIFTKLDLPQSGEANRRVLAVLRYLQAE